MRCLYTVRAVLQGHIHVNEDIDFRGLAFVTHSAEGFTTIRCTRDGGIHLAYRTYGLRGLTEQIVCASTHVNLSTFIHTMFSKQDDTELSSIDGGTPARF